MHHHHTRQEERLRLLEAWLPLAQAERSAQGWALDAAGLEELICAAAPALRTAPTLLAARAILWYHYTHQQTREEAA